MNGRRQDLSELGLVLVTSTELETIAGSWHQSYQRIRKDEEVDKNIPKHICMCVCFSIIFNEMLRLNWNRERIEICVRVFQACTTFSKEKGVIRVENCNKLCIFEQSVKTFLLAGVETSETLVCE